MRSCHRDSRKVLNYPEPIPSRDRLGLDGHGHRLIPLRDDNPSAIVPIVSWALIGACVLVFLWQLSLGPRDARAAVYALGVIPAILFEGARLPPELALAPPLATVFTSMFLHGGWMHLIGNMLYLWIFGDNVEDSMDGPRSLRGLLCAVRRGGGAGAVAAGHGLASADDRGERCDIGGARGYLLLYPHARVLVLVPLGFFFPVVRLPAGIVLGL